MLGRVAVLLVSLCRPTHGPPWSVDDSHWHLPSRRLRLAEPKPVRKGTAPGPGGWADPPPPTSRCSKSLRLSPPPVRNLCAFSMTCLPTQTSCPKSSSKPRQKIQTKPSSDSNPTRPEVTSSGPRVA